jgi:pyrroline-5-carboxylate reductase
MASFSILLVGAGKMGGALLARWQEKFPDYSFDVIEPAQSKPGWHKNLESLPKDYAPDVIVFAVKPQELAKILPAYRARFATKPLYISIAAGKTLAFFAKYLGEHAHVVRAMPNLPATIGIGTTILCAAYTLSQSARDTAKKLMESVGMVGWVKDESQMDAVTAVSGSGPAYVFLFIQSLIKAGIAEGLPEELAKMLAIRTVQGSAVLADKTGESLEQLRKNVTSPGGTTEAALKILMENGALEKLLCKAVAAAAKRSKELVE